jgi:N-acetylglucosaminyldiphosphoundecaprenol N-acetyl-beta-D-mannosaminyltransferase
MLMEIEDAIKEGRKLSIGNVNIYAMNLATERSSFKNSLNNFDIVFCDGYGVKIGASILGKKIPERFTPPDFIHDMMKIIENQKGSVFLLGAKPGIAEKAGEALIEKSPNLIIAGTQDGYFNKTKETSENQAVITKINSLNPSVLLIGLGMPLQEEWINENWASLNVSVVLPVGALFDTLSGTVPRAPRFLTDHGLEWLARLIIEPRRLWKRYIMGNPLFFLRIISQRLRLGRLDD